MIFTISFLIIHWYLSLFCQSFYLHRYISHHMFKLNKFWDYSFLLLTIIAQGPSFLRPAKYREMHLNHHKYSDQEDDPHSPLHHESLYNFMMHTYKKYQESHKLSETFPKTVAFADSVLGRTLFVLLYCALYISMTDSLYYLALVPIHSFLGPIHGAIVNWLGHKVGYRNYHSADNSKNTLKIDWLMMGELYQNNHHEKAQRSNFAHKGIEVDFTYLIMKVLSYLRIIRYV